jgi:hypothetical protein
MTLEHKAGIEGALYTLFRSGAGSFFLSPTQLSFYANDDRVRDSTVMGWIIGNPRRAQLYANKIATLTWSASRREG